MAELCTGAVIIEQRAVKAELSGALWGLGERFMSLPHVDGYFLFIIAAIITRLD